MTAASKNIKLIRSDFGDIGEMLGSIGYPQGILLHTLKKVNMLGVS